APRDSRADPAPRGAGSGDAGRGDDRPPACHHSGMQPGRARLPVRVIHVGAYPRAFRAVAPGAAGAEVIEVGTAEAHIPDVELLDVQLHVGDGIAVADELADLPRRSSSSLLGMPRSTHGGCGRLGWPVY